MIMDQDVWPVNILAHNVPHLQTVLLVKILQIEDQLQVVLVTMDITIMVPLVLLVNTPVLDVVVLVPPVLSV